MAKGKSKVDSCDFAHQNIFLGLHRCPFRSPQAKQLKRGDIREKKELKREER